jgi:hypothetical protein
MSVEQRQARRVLDAADWVLNGSKAGKADD